MSEQVLLAITDLHSTGVGIGYMPGRGRVYVPFAFPDEELALELQQQVRRGQWIAHRIFPPAGFCPVAGRCGGCLWPQAPYAQQLRWKGELLRRAIKHLAALAGIPLKIHGNAGNTGFRNRVHLHAHFYRGQFHFGFYAYRARQLVPISDCPVAEVPIRRVIAELANIKGASWPREDFGFGIELVHLAEEAAVMMVLYSAPQRRAALEKALPNFAALPSSPRVSLAFQPETLTYTWQKLPNVTLYTRPGCFQQVNRQQNEVVRSLVAAALERYQGGVFFDLYSGSGNYSLPLYRVARKIFGCDDNPTGITVAHYNIRMNGMENAHFVCADALELMANRERFGWPTKADFVLCDPARFGMAHGLPRLIAEARPAELILVSNNLSAFVRDARALLACNFTPQALHLVDFFPNTPRVNVVSMWKYGYD